LGEFSVGAERAMLRLRLDSLSEGGLLFKASAFSIHVDKDVIGYAGNANAGVNGVGENDDF
jgi:hypothetical protein